MTQGQLTKPWGRWMQYSAILLKVYIFCDWKGRSPIKKKLAKAPNFIEIFENPVQKIQYAKDQIVIFFFYTLEDRDFILGITTNNYKQKVLENLFFFSNIHTIIIISSLALHLLWWTLNIWLLISFPKEHWWTLESACGWT